MLIENDLKLVFNVSVSGSRLGLCNNSTWMRS